MEPLTYTVQEVADLLGIKVATFRNRFDDLVSKHGMPMRLPGRRRFSRRAIDQWIERYNGPVRVQEMTGTAIQHNQRLRLLIASGNAA